MPNFSISDLPLAILPLDLPNTVFEVQTFEGGVQVSRKIQGSNLQVNAAVTVEDEGNPLVTGADTLNFVGAGVVASGAGTTKTITISGGGAGGQVDTVVGGTNITVDVTDPINPIVNLDAAITGVSVNGVTLSNAGAATSYLDETGAYSVPAGGGGGGNVSNSGTPLVGQVPIWLDATTIEGTNTFEYFDGTLVLTAEDEFALVIDIQAPGGLVGGNSGIFFGTQIDNDEVLLMEFRAPSSSSGDDFTLVGNYSAQTVGQNRMYLRNSAGFYLFEFISDGRATIASYLTVDGTAAIPFVGMTTEVAISGLDAALLIQERGAAAIDRSAYGQIWVKNDTPNTLWFTDDAGTDFQLGSGAAVSGTPVSGQVAYWDSASSIEGNAKLGYSPLTGLRVDGTTASRPAIDIFLDSPVGNLGKYGIDFDTDVTNDEIWFMRFLDPTAGAEDFVWLADWQGGTGDQKLRLETNGTPLVEFNSAETVDFMGELIVTQTDVRIDDTLYIDEQAAAQVDIAGFGQFWVRNDTPNTPMFTDDAGTDYELNAGASAPQFIEQATDSTVNNTTTLANSQLILTNIPTGRYSLEMLVLARDVAVSSCGIRTQITTTGVGSINVLRGTVKIFSGSGAPTTDLQGVLTDLFQWASLPSGSGTGRILFIGNLEVTSATNSITVQFAQNTAQVGDLDFEQGSFLAVTRLGDV